MKIPVYFVDGMSGAVNSGDLDFLLRRRAIQSFRRSGGWVRVGYDALRDSGAGMHYFGKDRRNSVL